MVFLKPKMGCLSMRRTFDISQGDVRVHVGHVMFLTGMFEYAAGICMIFLKAKGDACV